MFCLPRNKHQYIDPFNGIYRFSQFWGGRKNFSSRYNFQIEVEIQHELEKDLYLDGEEKFQMSKQLEQGLHQRSL